MSHPLITLAGLAIAAFVILRRRRLEPTLLAGGAIVAVGCLLVGFGVVALPDAQRMIEDVGSSLGNWTYVFVAVFAFLETGAGIGLLVPGETVIVVGGAVAGQGEIDLLTLIGITWVAAVAGDTFSMFLGRKLGRGFLERHGHRVAITEERLRTVERFFERHGGPTILIGRFLGLVRALAPFLAGASRMPLRRFLPYDVVGCGLWATLFCVLGYLFSRSLDRIEQYIGTGALTLGTTVTVIVGLVFLHRLATRPEFRASVRASIAARPGGPAFLRVASPVLERLTGPARFVWHRITPGQLGLEVTTLIALTVVGAFAFAYLGEAPSGALDREAFDMADTVRTGPLDDAIAAFTRLGSWEVVASVVLATSIVALARRRTLDALTLLTGFGLTWLAVGEAKEAYGRARPEGPITESSGLSYPSGHAAFAVALVACAVVLVRSGVHWAIRVGLVAVTVGLAVAVALSRVYLRAHYLSDVLGGAALALAILGLCGLIAIVIAHLRHNAGERA